MMRQDGDIKMYFTQAVKAGISKLKTKEFWIKLYAVAFVIVLLISSFNIFIRNEYKIIGNRSIYLGSNMTSTMLNEMMLLEQVYIQDATIALLHNRFNIDVFKNKRVNFYGHQADIYYVFWEDRLVQVYFLIDNASAQERENTCNDIHSKLQQEFDVITDEGTYKGYPKKFANVLLEREKDFHSWLWRSRWVDGRTERNNVYTSVEYGNDFLPTNKELWELITGKNYERLADENAVVIEYCFEIYKSVMASDIESLKKADG